MTFALVTSPMVASATESEPSLGTYNSVMSTSLSKFYLKAQPNDAIVLDIQMVVDNEDLGKAESGIYFNLPRLRNPYYYNIVGNSMWYVDDNLLYPSLSLKAGATSPADTEINVQIMNAMTKTVTANCSVTVLNQLTGTARSTAPSLAKVKSGVTDADFRAITTPKKQLGAYNPALHNYALVTEYSVFVYDDSFSGWCNSEFGYNEHKAVLYDGHVFDQNNYYLNDAVTIANYKSVGASAGSLDLQIKPYFMSSEGGMFVTDMTEYSQRTGTLRAGASAQAGYMLVNNDGIILHEYVPDMDPAPENIQLAIKQGFSYTYNQLTNGHLAVISTDAFQYYPDTNKYTAITGESMEMPLYAPGPTLLPFVVEMNGTTGDKPVSPPPAEKTYYTVRFDYTGGLKSSYQDITPGADPNLPTPTKKGYTFKGWYVDELHTKLYDWRTFNYVLGGSYTLYADFELQGNYTVRFYDDKNSTDKTTTFSINDLPTLPATPTYTGYLFKNWLIVDNTAATSGTVYDPETFKPKNGDTYIFKAMWDVQGVILSVTTLQTEYWVGEKVDKSKLVVLVQTDSDGTTKTLSVAEFTVIPDTIEKVGRNTITVRYDATGATATVDLTGKSDYITGISAVYTGDDLEVGSVIPPGSIKVKLTYKSTKVVDTSEFSISPSTVKSAGTNTITVTSGGYSTSITINGKKKVVDTSANDGKGEVSNITASYTGKQLTVGDTIQGRDIKVTARFADGSTATVGNGDFTFSPSFVRNAGSNEILVAYMDKTCTLNITGIEKSSVTNDVSSSTKNPTTTGSTTGTSGTGTTAIGTSVGVSTGNGKDEKGTSVGYLGGKNVLDSLGSGTSSNITNDVDILREINEAQKGAMNVNVTLINTAEGNYLTPEMVESLCDKELTLNITMVSPKDKSSRVAYWTFDGKAMEKTDSFLDLNISFESAGKKAETMYHVYVSDYPYQKGMQCIIIMKDAYPLSTLVSFYTCNHEMKNSSYIGPLTWSNTLEIHLPITQSSHFAFTDYPEQYAEGSDLLYADESLTESADADTTDSEDYGDSDGSDADFDWGDDNTSDQPAQSEKSKKVNPKLIVFVIIIIFIVAAVVGGVCILLRSRALSNDDDDYDEDEIPEYEGDDIIEDEEEFEVEE